MTKLSEIKRVAEALTPKQLSEFDVWLHELIDSMKSQKHNSATPKRQVLKEHKTINRTLRLEMVRCGKKNCHCSEGQMHGPYWYAYWTEGGRTRSQYVGKKLPRGVKARKGSNKRGVR